MECALAGIDLLEGDLDFAGLGHSSLNNTPSGGSGKGSGKSDESNDNRIHVKWRPLPHLRAMVLNRDTS